MKKTILLGIISAAALASASAQVNVNLYTGFTSGGSGAPFSNLAQSFNSPDILFGASKSWSWFPLLPSGPAAFGADFTSFVNVPSLGVYTFSTTSDDGSALFIDGLQVVSNPGDHAPAAVSGAVSLSAGLHSLEVQFYENGVGSSGIDVTLPQGVTYATTPVNGVPDAASTLGLMGCALTAFGLLRRRLAC